MAVGEAIVCQSLMFALFKIKAALTKYFAFWLVMPRGDPSTMLPFWIEHAVLDLISETRNSSISNWNPVSFSGIFKSPRTYK